MISLARPPLRNRAHPLGPPQHDLSRGPKLSRYFFAHVPASSSAARLRLRNGGGGDADAAGAGRKRPAAEAFGGNGNGDGTSAAPTARRIDFFPRVCEAIVERSLEHPRARRRRRLRFDREEIQS